MRDLNFNRKQYDLFKPQIKRFSGIDSIKLVKPGSINPMKPRKKYRWWLIVLLLIFVSMLSLGGIFGTKAVKENMSFLNLFKEGKYLFIFQNNSEMRPTGGFIGSFAVVEFKDFKISKIDFNSNIYKLDNLFTQNRIISPPEPLYDICGGHWSLRDSNYAASFPEAAQKIEWFYNQETGNKVNGVIAVNASVVQELLKNTGPVDMAEYNTKISAENFFEELTNKIEVEYFLDQNNKQTNEPKTILKDMMPAIFKKALALPKVQLAKLIYNQIQQKQILFYFNDPKVQKAVLGENWGGEIRSFAEDYLYINNANVANVVEGSFVGGKSSLNVKETIGYKVEEQDKMLKGELTLTRSHAGSFIWPDGVNNNWTRIFVPEGAKLEKAELNGKDIFSEIKVDTEAGKTYFGLWIVTYPATSNILNLSYILPKNYENYNLLVQKQPGNLGDQLTVNFQGKLLFDGVLDTDKEINF